MRGAIAGAVMALVLGCTSTPAPDAAVFDAAVLDAPSRPPFVIADWRVRCDSVMGGCTEPPARSLTGEDGVDGQSISCRVTGDDTTKRLELDIGGMDALGTPYALTLDVTFPAFGGFASGTATVVDWTSTYQGVVGNDPPTEAQPCQGEIELSNDEMSMSSRVTVHLRCDHLPDSGDASERRAFTSHLVATEPADIEIYSCEGVPYSP